MALRFHLFVYTSKELTDTTVNMRLSKMWDWVYRNLTMVNGNIVCTGDLSSAGPLLNQKDTSYRQYGVTAMHINRIRYQTLLAPSEIKAKVPKYFQLCSTHGLCSHLCCCFPAVTAYMCHAIYMNLILYLNCKEPSINTVSVSEVSINVVL